MEEKDRIINWLNVAIAQSPTKLTESFYYDKLKQTFFSILAVDYFMFKDNLELDPSAESSYTDEQLKDVVSWIKRIEDEDDQIIRVPQLGIQDQELKNIKINEFIDSNGIDINNSKFWLVDEKISVRFDLTDQEAKPSAKKWWKFWK